MKKRLLSLTYSLFLVFSLQAQIHFFVETTGNMSLIPNSVKTVESQSIDPKTTYTLFMEEMYKENYKGIPGGNIMVGIQSELKSDFSLESGLELALIKFNRDIVLTHESMYLPVNIITPTPSTSYFSTELKSDFGLTYLSIPVSVFYQPIKRKLYVGGGVFPGLLVHSSSVTDDDYMFSKLCIAAQLQARYKMTEKISIVAAFQQYLSPIFKEEYYPGGTKNRLVKLGLRFDL